MVRGRDALAWPEVYFEQLAGCRSPHPQRRHVQQGPPGRGARRSPTPTPATRRDQDGQRPRRPEPDRAPAVGERPRHDRPLGAEGRAAEAGGLVVLVRLALLLPGPAPAGTAPRRAGAWAEVLDALDLAGTPPPSRRRAGSRTGRPGSRSRPRRIADQAERDRVRPARRPPTRRHDGRRRSRGTPRGTRQRAGWRRWWWSLDPRVFGRG